MRKIILLLFIILPFDFYGQAAQSDCPPRQACANYGPTGKLNGFGVQTLNAGNRGCLATNEHNSDWIVVTISASGTFEFTINPSAAADDMDYAVWGPNPNCPVVGAPIRCSYAASGGGNTGVSSANNAPQVDLSEGGGGNSWTQTMNVVAGQQYVILVDDFTNNKKYSMTFAGTSTIVCAPLPIELTKFEATACDKNVCLDWETASETNNDYFTVERSKDAIDFGIASIVNGAGNSTSTLNYSAIDNTPFEGVSYYRLKQTDFNGAFTYSNIEVVDFQINNEFSFNVYPNPNNGNNINLSIKSSEDQAVLVVVSDITGKENYSKVILTEASGDTVYGIDPDHKLPPGIYLITATSNQNIYTKKLIIK